MTEQCPFIDADGRVVTVTYIESTEDCDGLPATIDCPTEQATVTIYHGDDDGEDDG